SAASLRAAEASARPPQHRREQLAQKRGVAGQRRQRLLGQRGLFRGHVASGIETVDTYVGGLAGGGVLARSLAQRRAVGGGVEHVVHDLKGQSEAAAGRAQRRQRPVVGAAGQAAHHQGGLDHGGGLVEMDELQLGLRGVGLLFAKQILHLAADEAVAGGGVGEDAHQLHRQSGPVAVVADEQAEGVGEQRVAGEQGGGLVEAPVQGGAASAQIVVVHAG